MENNSTINPAVGSIDSGISQERPQRAVLVAPDLGEEDFELSLAELEELTATAGGEVVAVVTQRMESPNPATCIGSGRLEELAQFCRDDGEVDVIIFDRELSPVQIRNIEKATDVRVIDRTMLILDIFAGRARSSEGKLQVELAQLRYMLPRLTGKGIEMSRLGGGIGTRGPGETKLETDRRHIRRRIDALKEKLEQVAVRRAQRRARRKKTGVVTAAIVGYTNAGKSTLLNRLAGADVLAEDMLFATLDPTSRAIGLPSGGSVTLVDTVGFIRRLPHHLVEAFKSTLEEALDADVLILLCDGSDPNCLSQLDVSENLLRELGAGDKPTVRVLNKCDRAMPEEIMGIKAVRISAKHGDGIDSLLTAIEEALPEQPMRVVLNIPFSAMGELDMVRRAGEILSEEYTPEGVVAEALVDKATAGRLRERIVG